MQEGHELSMALREAVREIGERIRELGGSQEREDRGLGGSRGDRGVEGRRRVMSYCEVKSWRLDRRLQLGDFYCLAITSTALLSPLMTCCHL